MRVRHKGKLMDIAIECPKCGGDFAYGPDGEYAYCPRCRPPIIKTEDEHASYQYVLKEPAAVTVELTPNVFLDLTRDGRIIGVEQLKPETPAPSTAESCPTCGSATGNRWAKYSTPPKSNVCS